MKVRGYKECDTCKWFDGHLPDGKVGPKVTYLCRVGPCMLPEYIGGKRPYGEPPRYVTSMGLCEHWDDSIRQCRASLRAAIAAGFLGDGRV